MYKIQGNTNPFIINLTSDEEPFSIDQYFEIKDSLNKNPICRIVETSSKEENGKVIHLGVAKIESNIIKPINPQSEIVEPTFTKMKPYVMNTEPVNGFVLGEIMGTTYSDIPSKYKNLCVMMDEKKIRKQNKIPFVFDYKKLYQSPHIGLFGGSGSGKTFALKVFMEEAMKRGIPIVLLDPHLEMNFAANKSEIPDDFKHNFGGKFSIFTIGENIGIDFCDLTADELAGIMSFSGELSGPMDSLLRELHKKGESYLELTRKIEILLGAMEKKEYKKDYTPDEALLMGYYGSKIPHISTLQALSWRLASLNASNIFNKNIELIKEAMCKQKVCVVRGAMIQLNILSGYLIRKFYEMRRSYIDGKETGHINEMFPPFLIAMDEAHLFCPRNEEYTPTKKILRTIAQEGRKYGVFEILATQRPSLLDTTVVAQMANKLIFRISVKEDLTSIAKETDLTEEEVRRLPYMDSGECYVSSSIMGKTMSVKIRYNITEAKTSFNPFDELSNMNVLSPVEEEILKHLPITPLNIDEVIIKIGKETGKNFSLAEFNSLMDELHGKGKITRDIGMLGTSYILKT